MGKAYDEFMRKHADGNVVFEVHEKEWEFPKWAWGPVVLFVLFLYTAFNFAMGWRAGLRGCDLFIHTLTAFFTCIAKLMRLSSTPQHSRARLASETGLSGTSWV